AEGDHHTPIGLLRLQISQLLLRIRELGLGRLRLALSPLGLGLRSSRFTCPRLDLYRLPLLLRARNLLPRMRVRDSGLARLRMATCKVGVVVDYSDRLFLL